MSGKSVSGIDLNVLLMIAGTMGLVALALFAGLQACSPKDKVTALQLLDTFLRSLN